MSSAKKHVKIMKPVWHLLNIQQATTAWVTVMVQLRRLGRPGENVIGSLSKELDMA
tara:strand:+ start:342 stop:509 length:168 start_codon:yes stop_codon:yes gene_type:complete